MGKEGLKGYIAWIIVIVFLTIWSNLGFIWALVSGFVMTVMYGWKDRYKGLEHLKPQHVKDKETSEFIDMVENDPDAHAGYIKDRLDKAMKKIEKEKEDKGTS